MVAWRHEQSVHVVFDDFGNAACRGRDDGACARHRVEERRAEPFGDRAHDEEVEALDAADDVGTESWQQHVLLQIAVAHEMLEVLAQLAFAEHDEARVGNFLDDEVGRFYQVALPFVRHERGDVADHRRAMRQPERLVHVHRRRGGDVLDVDAFMNGDGPIRRHSIRQEQAADRVRRRDEAVDLPVFPPRERIALQVEVDAARRDERRRAAARRRAERQRDARHRDGVRIVRVDDVCSRLTTRANRHAAAKSISVRGASGTSSSRSSFMRPGPHPRPRSLALSRSLGLRAAFMRPGPHLRPRSLALSRSLGLRGAARRRSSPSGCATSAARCPIARSPLTVSSTWF